MSSQIGDPDAARRRSGRPGRRRPPGSSAPRRRRRSSAGRACGRCRALRHRPARRRRCRCPRRVREADDGDDPARVARRARAARRSASARKCASAAGPRAGSRSPPARGRATRSAPRLARRRDPWRIRAPLPARSPTVGVDSATSPATTRAIARRRSTRAREAGAELVAVRRAGGHRLPARGPAATRSTSCATPRAAVERLAAQTRGHRRGRRLPRARRGRLQRRRGARRRARRTAIYRKVHLPNYGVFDEQRYFQAGRARRA